MSVVTTVRGLVRPCAEAGPALSASTAAQAHSAMLSRSRIGLLAEREHTDLRGVRLGDQGTVDRLLLRLAGLAGLDVLVRLVDRRGGDLRGRLQDRGVHRPGLDGRHGVRAAVEADDLDLL